MNDRQQQTSARRRHGLGRRFPAAPTGADEALARARAADDDQCRLRPDHARQTRGYRETG